MKVTWAKLFSQFRDDYPELWRRGTHYQPFGYMEIEIRVPGVGKFVYNAISHDISWIERIKPELSKIQLTEEMRKDLYYRFISAIESYITDNGLTHQQFADRVGISRQSLSKYLNGISIPKADTMYRICSTMDIKI